MNDFAKLEPAAELQMKVFTSSPETFQVVSTLVYGEADAMLFDAQFTPAEARKLVEMIKETGKNLGRVYITHGHPDHFLGAGPIREIFPKAKFLASPETIALIRKNLKKYLAEYKQLTGSAFSGEPIVPDPLEETTLELEGNNLKIIKNVQGDDEGSTFIWIPSLKAVIAGDTVYDNVPLWVMETNKTKRQRWIETLEKIEKLEPETVVGGHAETGAKNSPAAIEFSKRYLAAYDEIAESSEAPAEMIEKIRKRFPELNGLEAVLRMSAEYAFRKN